MIRVIGKEEEEEEKWRASISIEFGRIIPPLGFPPLRLMENLYCSYVDERDRVRGIQLTCFRLDNCVAI